MREGLNQSVLDLSPSVRFLSPVRVVGVLESIPSILKVKAGATLDKWPVHRRADTQRDKQKTKKKSMCLEVKF